MTHEHNEDIKVLILTGPADSGKSTVAKYLELQHQAEIKHFAEPLKNMICRGFGVDMAWLNGPEKNRPSEIFGGKSPREAMQTLGTEWGRNIIHPDLWVTTAVREVRYIWERSWPFGLGGNPEGVVVFDDGRFGNEVSLMQEAFTTRVLKLIPTYEGYEPIPNSGHASELQELPWDVSIENSGDVGKLVDDVEEALKGIWL